MDTIRHSAAVWNCNPACLARMLAVAVKAQVEATLTSFESYIVDISSGYHLVQGLKNLAFEIQTDNSDYQKLRISCPSYWESSGTFTL